MLPRPVNSPPTTYEGGTLMAVDDEHDGIQKPQYGIGAAIHKQLQRSKEHWAAIIHKDRAVMASVRNYEFLIGRSAQCNLVIMKSQVDLLHCRLYVGDDDKVYLESLSKSGVYRNGRIVEKGGVVPLKDRDMVGLAKKCAALDFVVYLRGISKDDPPAFNAEDMKMSRPLQTLAKEIEESFKYASLFYAFLKCAANLLVLFFWHMQVRNL
ncbi:hypothetical protein HDU67_003699 [Dinochytrium kinnereticum]|nr:hypothetical protein HDU67_003699 [Dinochytrium kinnereticum]